MKPFVALGFLAVASSAYAQASMYGQCGGMNWSGPTTCVSGAVCTYLGPYHSQCLPVTASATPTSAPITTPSTSPTTTPTTAPTTTPPTTTAPSTTSPLPSTPINPSSCPSNTPASSAGRLQFVGVNIAGFDFGCDTSGNCNNKIVVPPNGAGQMQHFSKDDGMNIFRLPVGWQYLASSPAGPLNSGNLATYDRLMQSCLATGAYCILDIHNYARWNGQIVGQGGPTNAQFAQFWSLLAAKYANQPKVIFGVMNEPHDIPDINAWAATVQAAVTAIRQAGATSQIILLPGNNYTSAGTFISSGSAAALNTVVNPDGSFTNLIFDVHKYLDSDNSGQSTQCTTNNIDGAFAPLAQWLRCHGRQAMNTETGGGNTQSCETDLCQQIAFQRANSDVIIGVVAWSAGAFGSTYALDLTPTQNGNGWTDQALVTSCLKNAH